jgi:cytochrome c biogenesis protein CcmG/thiol:disulfide interchange protein DsbE
MMFLFGALATARSQSSAKPAPNAGKSAAAELQLIDLAGYNQVLAKYKGKPILVTFWATWCEPCRDEYPLIVDLEKKYASQGLVVFGVDMDDDAEMNLVRRFIARNQPRFPNYRQKPGIDLDAFYRGVNPAWTGAMPETVFYSRDGRIAGHFIGGQTREAFDQAIHTILASSVAASSGK